MMKILLSIVLILCMGLACVRAEQAAPADACGLCRIELDHVSVKAGPDVLVEDASFHIHCGQLTALVGPTWKTPCRAAGP